MSNQTEIKVLVAGEELTQETVESYRSAWVPKAKVRGCKVVLDMSACEIVTTPGLGLMMELNRLAGDYNGKFVVCGLKDQVLEVVTKTQLGRILKLASDTSQAEQLLKA